MTFACRLFFACRHLTVLSCVLVIFGVYKPLAAAADDVVSAAPLRQNLQRHAELQKAASIANPTPMNVAPAKSSEVASAAAKTLPAKLPYYVDFRARTAASYGHAFVWYGKTSERKVEVAGLHPAGDVVPYVLGHLMWVPSETGASYGDLDEQYLTASYRVYLSEPDAKRVFAYIKELQASSPLWNAETSNCTYFIGKIATFMGLKAPFHLQVPEEYVKSLRQLNNSRQTVQLAAAQ
jgi:hypothetical protein